MNNPCNQCIVNPICKEVCDLLLRYLIDNLPDPEYHHWQYGTIGQALRQRVWKLVYLNDKLIGVEHYGKPMQTMSS